jgi:hypothetical protein
MAAGTVTLYSKNKNLIKMSDLSSATIKLLLTTSTYVPDTSVTGNSVLADVTNELANANGYTTGGVTLSAPTITAITGGYKFSSGNASWTASGGSIPAWRNGVIYASGTLWGLTSPLLGFFLGDATPADIAATASGNSLTVNCPTAGWFDLT